MKACSGLGCGSLVQQQQVVFVSPGSPACLSHEYTLKMGRCSHCSRCRLRLTGRAVGAAGMKWLSVWASFCATPVGKFVVSSFSAYINCLVLHGRCDIKHGMWVLLKSSHGSKAPHIRVGMALFVCSAACLFHVLSRTFSNFGFPLIYNSPFISFVSNAGAEGLFTSFFLISYRSYDIFSGHLMS